MSPGAVGSPGWSRLFGKRSEDRIRIRLRGKSKTTPVWEWFFAAINSLFWLKVLREGRGARCGMLNRFLMPGHTGKLAVRQLA